MKVCNNVEFQIDYQMRLNIHFFCNKVHAKTSKLKN